MSLEGHCACGGVRYRLSSLPMFVHCCHCRWCQRESGSAFIINALIESDRVIRLEGSVEEITTPSASGKGQRIVRCSHCHVALWSHYAYGPIGDLVAFVRVGTLVAPPKLPPEIHIFTESRQPWLTLPSDVPVVPRFYKASEHWPEESLARRAALFDALSKGR